METDIGRSSYQKTHSSSEETLSAMSVTPTINTRRARSNSRSAGSTSTEPLETFSIDKLSHPPEEVQEKLQPLSSQIPQRGKYTHILVLKSLNGTFETKFLVIPFKPDTLKLGRPIVNTASSKNDTIMNGVRKTAQKASQVRIDNGNFNSRVLSRTHASLCYDSVTGKIYIRDLKSSNGTFLNGSRIGQIDIELKIGDVIDLGTDIDSKLEHRRISALVEDISVIPLINETVDLLNSNTLFKNSRTVDNDGKRYLNENETSALSYYQQQNAIYGTGENGYLSAPALSAQRAAFEAAVFGDVTNIDLEDEILGSETEILSGIFMNNSVGTSANLINVMKMISNEIALEKREHSKLKSMENFLINYTTNVGDIDLKLLERNENQLEKLHDALKQRLSKKHKEVLDEQKERSKLIEDENTKLLHSFEMKEVKQDDEIKSLQSELEELKRELEKEKSYNEPFSKTSTITNKESLTGNSSEIGYNKKREKVLSENIEHNDGDNWNWKNSTILIFSTLFVGIVAYSLNLSTKPII